VKREREIMLENDGDGNIVVWDWTIHAFEGTDHPPRARLFMITPQELATIGVHYLPDEEAADVEVVHAILLSRLKELGYRWEVSDVPRKIRQALRTLVLAGPVRSGPDPIPMDLIPKTENLGVN